MGHRAAVPDLTGRTALVTGAAGDIGRAVARSLVASGASVVLADLGTAEDRLGETRDDCQEQRPGARIQLSMFDVTDPAAVQSAASEIATDAATPDLLFNNAGYQGQFANIVKAPLDDVTTVFDVNVIGVFTVLQVFAQALVAEDRSGAVVNTASMAGVSGAPNMAAYSASKAAVIGLTRAAAKDLAPFGIRVNAISPGFIGPGAMWDNQVRRQAAVSSPYYADNEAAVANQMIGQVPLGRYGQLSEVAAIAHFLLSDAASYITGTNTEISGGAT